MERFDHTSRNRSVLEVEEVLRYGFRVGINGFVVLYELVFGIVGNSVL